MNTSRAFHSVISNLIFEICRAIRCLCYLGEGLKDVGSEMEVLIFLWVFLARELTRRAPQEESEQTWQALLTYVDIAQQYRLARQQRHSQTSSLTHTQHAYTPSISRFTTLSVSSPASLYPTVWGNGRKTQDASASPTPHAGNGKQAEQLFPLCHSYGEHMGQAFDGLLLCSRVCLCAFKTKPWHAVVTDRYSIYMLTCRYSSHGPLPTSISWVLVQTHSVDITCNCLPLGSDSFSRHCV